MSTLHHPYIDSILSLYAHMLTISTLHRKESGARGGWHGGQVARAMCAGARARSVSTKSRVSDGIGSLSPNQIC